MVKRFGVDIEKWQRMSTYEQMQTKKQWMLQKGKDAQRRKLQRLEQIRKRRRGIRRGPDDKAPPPELVGPPEPDIRPVTGPTHGRRGVAPDIPQQGTIFTQQQYMQQQYDIMKQLERQHTEAQTIETKRPPIDPMGLYFVDTPSGKKLITGFEAKQQIRDYQTDVGAAYLGQQTMFQQSLGYDPRTQFIVTDTGYKVKKPDTSLDWTKEEFRKIDKAYKIHPALGFTAELGFSFVSGFAATGKPVAEFILRQAGVKPKPVHYVTPWDVGFERIGWSPEGSTKILSERPVFAAGGVTSEIIQGYVFGKAISKAGQIVSPYVKRGVGFTGRKTVGAAKKISDFLPTEKFGRFGHKVLDTEPFEYFGKWTQGWSKSKQLVSGVGRGGVRKTTTQFGAARIETIKKTITYTGKQKVWLSPAEKQIAQQNIKRLMGEGFEFSFGRLTKKSVVTNIYDDLVREGGYRFSKEFGGKGSLFNIGQTRIPITEVSKQGRWITFPYTTSREVAGTLVEKQLTFEWGFKQLGRGPLGKFQTPLAKGWISKLSNPSFWMDEFASQRLIPAITTVGKKATSRIGVGMSVYSPNVAYSFGSHFGTSMLSGMISKNLLRTIQPTGKYQRQQPEIGRLFKIPDTIHFRHQPYMLFSEQQQDVFTGFKPVNVFKPTFDTVSDVVTGFKFDQVQDVQFNQDYNRMLRIAMVSGGMVSEGGMPSPIRQFKSYVFPTPFGYPKKILGFGAGSLFAPGGDLGYRFRMFNIPDLDKLIRRFHI